MKPFCLRLQSVLLAVSALGLVIASGTKGQQADPTKAAAGAEKAAAPQPPVEVGKDAAKGKGVDSPPIPDPAKNAPAGKAASPEQPPPKDAPPAPKEGEAPKKEGEPAAPPAPAPVQVIPSTVRPSNRERYADAEKSVSELTDILNRLSSQQANERANPVGIKSDFIRALRTIHEIHRKADELALRGEVDSHNLRQSAGQGFAVLEGLLRVFIPRLVDPPRTPKAAPKGKGAEAKPGDSRRNERINATVAAAEKHATDGQWDEAYEELNKALDLADSIGPFTPPPEAANTYRPVHDAQAKILPQYFEHRRKAIAPELWQEYNTVRPKISPVAADISGSLAAVNQGQPPKLEGKTLLGPEFVGSMTQRWIGLDNQCVQGLAILHAIGPEAAEEVERLSADYAKARADLIVLIVKIIESDAATRASDEAERHYVGYLATIPNLMSSIHATPKDFQGAHAPLDALAAKNPDLAARVAIYKQSTSEIIRWRRKLSQQNLKRVHEAFPMALPYDQWLNQPPPLEDQAKSPRLVQTAWRLDQTPAFVSGIWSAQWKDFSMRVPAPVVLWLPDGRPLMLSKWHNRAMMETAVDKDLMNAFFAGVNFELLGGPDRAPLTLEAMFLVHTAAHGPFVEVGGLVTQVEMDSIADRLWDVHNPFDLPSALDAKSLAAFPDLAGLIRMQLNPTWIAHEMFVWSVPLPKPAASASEDRREPASDSPASKEAAAPPTKRRGT